ncbi:MAG TPA: MBL fold metallo-hydrolase [Vicinamibacterales bacterium]|nr:MBL fold metallo-hydrolase [Vicinamibacterales bacterium]
MIVETAAVGPFFKNGFVVGCERTREAVLIDPGDEVASLLAFARGQSLAITFILLTHAHPDHVTGVPEARRTLNVPILLHEEDLPLYEHAPEEAAKFGIHCDPLPPVDRFYTAADVIRFGDYEVRPVHTPGHSPGGVCLAVTSPQLQEPQLFVGDTLFAGSIGSTEFWRGDYDTLIASIRDVLFSFGDAAHVYPGHGPETTIGRERRMNPFLI